MLRIAVPNKGSLSEASTEMLREAGYRQRHDTKDLVLLDEDNGVEFYYLRPRDIAVYVGERTLHPLEVKTEGETLTFTVELCVPLAQPEKPAMEPPGRMATLNLDI